MNTKYAYHTALGDRYEEFPATDRVEHALGVAFVHDLAGGIPEEMVNGADVFYADVPWAAGYEKFASRAGVPQKLKYRDFVGKLGKEIRLVGKPAAIVTGKHAVRQFAPDATAEVSLNGDNAVACLWRITPWAGRITTEMLIKTLAKRFNCVGDFCCGYGRSGRIFVQNGKTFIMSDLNAACIGHIKHNIRHWQ